MSTEKQRLTFLSYSRINKDFALQLARELKSSGFNIWIDQLDIPTGARWDDELEKALEECEVFMVILTPASSASDNVKDEIGYAIDTNKRILPILLENANVPLRLRRFQYVDFTGKTYDEGVEGAKQQLRKLIDEPTIPQPQLSPAEQAQKAESDRQKKEKIVAHKVETARKEKEADAPKVAPTPTKSEKPTPTAPPPAVSKPVVQPAPAKVEPVAQPAPAIVQPVAQPVSQPAPATAASVPTPSQPVQKKGLSKPLMIGLGVGALAIMAVCGIVGVGLLGGGEPVDPPPVVTEVVVEEPEIIPNTGSGEIVEEVAPIIEEEAPAPEEVYGSDAPAYTVTSVYYDGGEFVQISPTEWLENAGGDQYYFWEDGRDEWSVYLYDEYRGVNVRLDLWTGEVLADENTGNGEYVLYPISDTVAEIKGFNVWHVFYDGGEFYQSGEYEWVEYNSGEEYVFIEDGRDEWSVYLYYEPENLFVHIDLWTGEIYVDNNDGEGPVYFADITSVE